MEWGPLPDMSRTAKESDFPVDVEGMGRFKFARRTQKDKYQIRSLYAQLTDNNYSADGVAVDMEAWTHATISVLVVEEPESSAAWPGLDKLDPLMDDDTADKLQKVFMALRQKELSFRPQPAEPVSAASAGPTA